jgi:hypothetical protein
MWRIWLLTLSGGLALAAAPAVREDAPSSSAPTSGSVTVQIAPAAKVKEIYALCRATGQRYKPQRADQATGQAVFDNLPGDAHYDIGVVTSDGWQVEGIDLSWHEDRLLRLAAKRRVELGLPSEAAHEFSRADADELLKYVRDLQAFEDVRRVLYLRGDGQRAAMLVEPMRAREFYNHQGDEIIWRTELWYFRYRYGGWERVPNVERVLERRRISAAQWQQLTVLYYPELCVYLDEHGRSQPLKWTLPAEPDPARGRLAGTPPAQDTQPIIIGLPADEPASSKARQP